MKKGSALLLVVLILGTFMVLGALLIKIVYNNYAGANSALQREQAFYLAEAGLEKGKVELAHNSEWYTDIPYYLEDNVNWILNYAVGQTNNLGEGNFKLVRENGKNYFYSIGSKGQGIVILKLRFSNPPFQSLEWQEI